MVHHRHWSAEQAPLNSGKHLFVCSQSDARLSLPPTTPSSPPPQGYTLHKAGGDFI